MATPGGNELPHLDGLVQTSRHEIFSIWRKSDRVDTILVSIWSLETFNKVARNGIPYANTLVKRSCCDKLGIRRNSNSSDTILDAKSEDVLASLDIPQADCAITTSGGDGTTITSEVQRVDILLVTRKGVSDSSGSDIPDLTSLAYHSQREKAATYSDQLILGTSCKVPSIGTEANASNVQISNRVDGLILKNADLRSGDHVKDLGRPVTSSRDIFPIVAESNAANNTLVLKSVKKVDVKHSWDFRVEDGEPVRFDLFLVLW